MRLLAFLLIWISLGVGAVAATTAYVWKVPAEGDQAFQIGTDDAGNAVYAVLAADAGKIKASETDTGETDTGETDTGEADTAKADDAGEDKPIAKADTALTPKVVEQLKAGGVGRVRVKTFKLSRWTHLPHFGVACFGLLAGAVLTRLGAARDAKLAEEQAEHPDAVSPEKALAELRVLVAALLEEIPGIADESQACHAITQRIGDATAELVPAIVDRRELLVGRMGLGTYAGLMDVFSAAERAMNRAWSAAADEALDESMEALARASERLAVAEDKLTGRTPSLLPLG